MFNRKNKYHIYLTEEERRLALNALIDKRNALIAAGRYTDAIDDSLRHSSTTYKLKISGGDIKTVQGDTGHAQAS